MLRVPDELVPPRHRHEYPYTQGTHRAIRHGSMGPEVETTGIAHDATNLVLFAALHPSLLHHPRCAPYRSTGRGYTWT